MIVGALALKGGAVVVDSIRGGGWSSPGPKGPDTLVKVEEGLKALEEATKALSTALTAHGAATKCDHEKAKKWDVIHERLGGLTNELKAPASCK